MPPRACVSSAGQLPTRCAGSVGYRVKECDMIESYLEAVALIERLHRNYRNLVRESLDRIGSHDINSVQALILFNIGATKIAVNEVRTHGNYFGSNTGYIIKKLIANGYLLHERSPRDLRSVDIWLSNKGRSICDRLIEMHNQHIRMFPELDRDPDLDRTVWTLRQIEQFWIDQQVDR
jgi:DNA-binding MarR family transcriptional regulator